MNLPEPCLIRRDDVILVTGSNGFIGCKVVDTLLEWGFRNLKCFVRSSGQSERLREILTRHPLARVEIIQGNLLSSQDCERAARGVRLIYHLAAGIEKSFPGAFMNSVLTTRNLLEAVSRQRLVRRFVNISSFAVYSNRNLRRGALLDESCEIESPSHRRGDAYAYAKIKQDELVLRYSRAGIPCVIVRPGAVYGPGKRAITGRVGIDTFGVYLHLGGSNRLPLSYVDNCADAIVLAGLTPGVDGEIFNVVDDNLPRSRTFLRLYKKNVRNFLSVPIPYLVTSMLCSAWEKYSDWSEGQLPAVFNRSRCSAEWRGNEYSNSKLKRLLNWSPRVPFSEASRRYFEYQRSAVR
jgi:nucleoside-diphosphate-sugar epimerase